MSSFHRLRLPLLLLAAMQRQKIILLRRLLPLQLSHPSSPRFHFSPFIFSSSSEILMAYGGFMSFYNSRQLKGKLYTTTTTTTVVIVIVRDDDRRRLRPKAQASLSVWWWLLLRRVHTGWSWRRSSHGSPIDKGDTLTTTTVERKNQTLITSKERYRLFNLLCMPVQDSIEMALYRYIDTAFDVGSMWRQP